MSTRRILYLAEDGQRSRYIEAALLLLREHGYDVTFVTVRARGPIHDVLADLGFRALALGSVRSLDYPRAAATLAAWVHRYEFEIIHSHESIPALVGGVAGALAGRGTRFFHRHHIHFESAKQSWLSRVACNVADAVIAVSKSAARAAIEIDRVHPAQVYVARNGVRPLRTVSDDEVAALKRRLAIPAGAKVITLVARLRPEKGHETLFDALAYARQPLDADIHVAVVGAGAYEERVRERARSARGGVVHFVGHQEDVAPWFALGDVSVVPSYVEPFGLTAIETMTMHRPLIASRVGGLAEIVEHDVSGLLVEPRDARALGAALTDVLTDPERARRLAQGGYRRYEARFTMDAMVGSWEHAYRRFHPRLAA